MKTTITIQGAWCQTSRRGASDASPPAAFLVGRGPQPTSSSCLAGAAPRNRRSVPLNTRLLAAGLAAAALAMLLDAPTAAAEAPAEITVDIDVGEPIMLADKDQIAYVKITLGGFALPADNARPPVNLALVLDRSSSMSGEKFDKAKAAALMVVDRLRPNDIISVISYDSTVEVLVPAVAARERDYIRRRIQALTPRGSTALFAGVSYGIEEVSKNLSGKYVNRIVLLSDGQANIGPSSPNELGRLGASAGRQGISISTIGLGLGYNEDLMAQIAQRSDGNHAFARNADDLATIFKHELGDILSVVAQDVEIELLFDKGVRPIRSLNRDATINGNKVRFSLNQLYAAQKKFALLEVRIPAGAANTKRDIARVDVSYANMISHRKRKQQRKLAVGFTRSARAVRKHQNTDVMVAAVEAIATERNQRAVILRDEGKIAAARSVLKQNSAYLKGRAKHLKSKRLEKYAKDNFDDADNLAPDKWQRRRKSMREEQLSNASQRSW